MWDNALWLRLDRARTAVGGPKLCFQLLVYSVTDIRVETESMK